MGTLFLSTQIECAETDFITYRSLTYIEPILVAVCSPYINIKWDKSNFKVMDSKKKK